MKYSINGAVGDIAFGPGYTGVTLVQLNSSFVEFDDSGTRRVFSRNFFQSFQFSSYGTPLTPKFHVGGTVTDGTTNYTVTGLDGALELEDASSGAKSSIGTYFNFIAL